MYFHFHGTSPISLLFGIIGVVGGGGGVVGIWRTEAIVVLRTDRPIIPLSCSVIFYIFFNKYEVLIAGAKVKFYILLLFLHVFLFLCFCIFFIFLLFFLFLCINSWRRRVLFLVFLIFLVFFCFFWFFWYFWYFWILIFLVFVRTVHTNFHEKSGLCSSRNEWVLLNFVIWRPFCFSKFCQNFKGQPSWSIWFTVWAYNVRRLYWNVFYHTFFQLIFDCFKSLT